jgi:hypothetical protein
LCEDKVIDGFVSLNEMTDKEFLAAPSDLALQTIEHIATSQESKEEVKGLYAWAEGVAAGFGGK